jgi:photosystem II stability/assembly factor-like uncharacterized protein
VAVAVVAAAVIAVGATVLARDIVGQSRRVVVDQQPEPKGTSPEVLADGAPVLAAQLYADPVFLDATEGFSLALGTGGNASERLVASTDGGASWRVAGAQFPVAGVFSTLLFTDLEHGYVFGPAGLIITTDGGRSWTQASLTGEVQRVIPAFGDVWAVLTNCPGAPGVLVSCPVEVEISSNAGASWRPTSQPPVTEGSGGGAVLGRISADGSYLLTWGSSKSGLALTEDGGASWSPVPDPCASGWTVEDMAALVEGQLWLVCGAAPTAAGEVKAIFRSYDGGQHWSMVASTGFVPGAQQPVGSLSLSGDLYQLATVSPDQAWLGVGGVGVLETNDGGMDWAPVQGISDPDTEGGVGVTFIRSPNGTIEDGWALGFGYGVWRTTDATHWHEVAGS